MGRDRDRGTERQAERERDRKIGEHFNSLVILHPSIPGIECVRDLMAKTVLHINQKRFVWKF